MLNIVGINTLYKIFYMGFCFISGEDIEYFTFVLENFHAIYDQLRLDNSRTFIMGKDEALMNATKMIFPSADLMICIWHINNNILTKAKLLFCERILDVNNEIQDE